MERRPSTRDYGQELLANLEQPRNGGRPIEGVMNLSREMESDEEDQLDVDQNILDFMAYKATDAVFQWRAEADPHQSDLPGALVSTTNDWVTVMRHKYGTGRLNTRTAFRVRLLQFVLAFTHRFNHDNTWTTEDTLGVIQAQNTSRGAFWQQTTQAPALRNSFDTYSEFPLSEDHLVENREKLSNELHIPMDKRRWVKDLSSTPSLSVLLPLFVELTAAYGAVVRNWSPGTDWFELIGEFMLQAVIEEYLLNGASGEEAFDTIFAFGCPGIEPASREASDIKAMRKLFCSDLDAHEEVHDWARFKHKYIKELLPQAGTSMTFLQAMQNAREEYPYQGFEAMVVGFLGDLHEKLDKPDLVQVEERRISIEGNELAEEEAREAFRRMGV